MGNVCLPLLTKIQELIPFIKKPEESPQTDIVQLPKSKEQEINNRIHEAIASINLSPDLENGELAPSTHEVTYSLRGQNQKSKEEMSESA